MSARQIRTPQDLGASIRDARRSRRLTQAELARRAGVSREWLIGVENGSRPRAELTKMLAVLAALDLDLTIHPGSDATDRPATASSPTPDAEPTQGSSHDASAPSGLTTAEASARALATIRQERQRSGSLLSHLEQVAAGRSVRATEASEKGARS